MQVSPYPKHLHLPVHALVRPHLVNSQQLGVRGVQKIFHSSSCFIHPQLDGLGISGCCFNACPHTYPACGSCHRCGSAAVLSVTAPPSMSGCFRLVVGWSLLYFPGSAEAGLSWVNALHLGPVERIYSEAGWPLVAPPFPCTPSEGVATARLCSFVSFFVSHVHTLRRNVAP